MLGRMVAEGDGSANAGGDSDADGDIDGDIDGAAVRNRGSRPTGWPPSSSAQATTIAARQPRSTHHAGRRRARNSLARSYPSRGPTRRSAALSRRSGGRIREAADQAGGRAGLCGVRLGGAEPVDERAGAVGLHFGQVFRRVLQQLVGWMPCEPPGARPEGYGDWRSLSCGYDGERTPAQVEEAYAASITCPCHRWFPDWRCHEVQARSRRQTPHAVSTSGGSGDCRRLDCDSDQAPQGRGADPESASAEAR